MLEFISKQINGNIKRVTLDDITLRTLAIEDPKLFLETYPTPIIIDEFQYAPDLLSYIKMIVDNKRLEGFETKESANGMYYLTGSQRFLAMEQVSESLAGRVAILDLYGLSNKEINNKQQKLFIPEISKLKVEKNTEPNLTIKELFERIYKGSFPEIYKNPDLAINDYFTNYIKTYIEKDIRKLINVKDEIKFMKFMIAVAARTGQELRINEICNDAEVSNPTGSSWLSILVNSGLVVLLEPYSKNIIKRVVKSPKLYFMDTGLASHLIKFPNAETLESSYFAGAIFETYVVSEIIKSFTNKGIDPKIHLYYYRDNHNKEIDVVIEYNNKLYPIEIKKGKKPSKTLIKNFTALENTGLEIANGIVLCMIDEIFPINKNNYYIPIRYI